MKMKSLKTQFIGAIAMVLVAAIAMGSSTYAWFAMNQSVTATNMQVKVKSNSTFLLIGEAALTTADQIQAQVDADLTSEDLSVNDNDAALYPAKAYFNDSNDDFATTVDAAATAITTKALAAIEGNWYSANSTDATVWGGSGKVASDAVLTSSNFTSHVIKKSVNLTLADGSSNANNLTVTPTITMKDTYNKTSDITVKAGKTYYTTNGTAFTEVTTPEASALGTYYEKANDITAVKVLVVTDNNQVVVLDSTTSGPVNLYGTTNQDITDTTVHHVDIYIYYDGTAAAVYTNNAVNLSGATINLAFGVSVNA